MGSNGLATPKLSVPRTTVEQCHVLDVNALVRAGAIKPNVHMTATLKIGRGEVWFETCTLPWKAQYFRIRAMFGDQLVDNAIELATTRPPYGGLRWWFVCPVTGKRVWKVYLPQRATQYASRQAYRLAYQCQSERPWQRAIRRADKIRARLGGESCLDELFPEKPKGMWWSTYGRLLDKAYEVENRAELLLPGAAHALHLYR